MRRRVRRRVDWDEELRKTERIRRRGIFISLLSFGVTAAFVWGASRLRGMGMGKGLALDRKVVFAACLLVVALLVRGLLRRRERLREEKREREEELALQQIREKQMREKGPKP